MRQARGFTLLELMIVVVVIAVLAAIALPSYTDFIARGKFVEAHGQLADLRVKLEQFYQDNRNYGSTAAVCGIAMPPAATVRYFDYGCNWGPIGTNQAYVITATGRAAEGIDGILFTITESQVRATTVNAGTTMANRGYTNSGTCWVRKKPNQC